MTESLWNKYDTIIIIIIIVWLKPSAIWDASFVMLLCVMVHKLSTIQLMTLSVYDALPLFHQMKRWFSSLELTPKAFVFMPMSVVCFYKCKWSQYIDTVCRLVVGASVSGAQCDVFFVIAVCVLQLFYYWHLSLSMFSGGLTIVPIVPWHRPPA